MRDLIDLSIDAHEQVALRVAGWPTHARADLAGRLRALQNIAGVEDRDDSLVLTIPRGGDLVAIKHFVRDAATEILPDHGMIYRR